jgi:hypothetical protein
MKAPGGWRGMDIDCICIPGIVEYLFVGMEAVIIEYILRYLMTKVRKPDYD